MLRIMKKAILSTACLALCGSAFAVTMDSPVGVWKTIDDKTGVPKSLVRVVQATNGTLQGRVIKLLPGATKTICDTCPGAFKNKPITGLPIMWGYKPSKTGMWVNGRVLDPKNGKIYSSNLRLSGNTLLVRGYVGISAFGRTQMWQRVQ